MKPAPKIIRKLPSSQKTTPVPPQHSVGKPLIIAIITIAAVIGLVLLLLNTDRLAGKATFTEVTTVQKDTTPACAPVPAGLIAWWQGENNANEIGGHHGTLVGGVTFGTGKVGKAFSLNSALKQYVTADSVSELMTGQEFSFGAWVKPLDSARGAVLSFHTAAGSNKNMIFWSRSATTGSNQFSYFEPSLNYNDALLDSSVNAWHHVMVTVDSQNKGHIYVDGGLSEDSFEGVTVRPAPGDRFSIGQEWDGLSTLTPPTLTPTDFFNGLIDEVMIFNKALTKAEVNVIYNAGSGGVCPVEAVPPPAEEPVCGDSKLDTTLGEECDDGNTDPDDGCSPLTCRLEAGWTCTEPTVETISNYPAPGFFIKNNPSVCTAEETVPMDGDLDGVPDDVDPCPGTSDAKLVYPSINYAALGCYYGDIDKSGCVAPEEYTFFKDTYKMNADGIQVDLSPGDYTLYKAKYTNGEIPACGN